MQNIKDKYVICSFGIDSHKLVKVNSETKAKFTFEIDYGKPLREGFPITEYTQMKNTILAVGKKEELQEIFNSIFEQENIIDNANKIRFEIIRKLKKTINENLNG